MSWIQHWRHANEKMTRKSMAFLNEMPDGMKAVLSSVPGVSLMFGAAAKHKKSILVLAEYYVSRDMAHPDVRKAYDNYKHVIAMEPQAYERLLDAVKQHQGERVPESEQHSVWEGIKGVGAKLFHK